MVIKFPLYDDYTPRDIFCHTCLLFPNVACDSFGKLGLICA